MENEEGPDAAALASTDPPTQKTAPICVLTPAGERVLALYREIEAKAQAACRDEIRQLLGTVAKSAA